MDSDPEGQGEAEKKKRKQTGTDREERGGCEEKIKKRGPYYHQQREPYHQQPRGMYLENRTWKITRAKGGVYPLDTSPATLTTPRHHSTHLTLSTAPKYLPDIPHGTIG